MFESTLCALNSVKSSNKTDQQLGSPKPLLHDQSQKGLVTSPNFDVARVHRANQDRLMRLESIGDCSNLRGDQLDAFLEDFLQREDDFSSFRDHAVAEKSLDCETRWITRRA